jgi:hypothetical protein
MSKLSLKLLPLAIAAALLIGAEGSDCTGSPQVNNTINVCVSKGGGRCDNGAASGAQSDADTSATDGTDENETGETEEDPPVGSVERQHLDDLRDWMNQQDWSNYAPDPRYADDVVPMLRPGPPPNTARTDPVTGLVFELLTEQETEDLEQWAESCVCEY